MNPKLSIITIVYNGANLIDDTIKSVLKQSYDNIEYVIIDGASTDNTLERIQAYGNKINVLVSEPDKGLYDAMNKGLAKATGDYVLFMNCGDWLYDEDTITTVFGTSNDADVYYGECMFVDDARNELGLRSKLTVHGLPTDLHWKNMNKGMVVSHQSFIAKRALASRYIDNNLCADIDWVIDILKKAKNTQYVPITISQFLIGGVSTQRHQQSLKDRYNVLSKHYGFLPNVFNHCWIVMRGVINGILK
jgi:glycosyltransferase involved in cell wall biosynthesis